MLGYDIDKMLFRIPAENHTFEEITDYVCKNAKEGDLILTMGGGNVYMCANMIYKQLKFIEDGQE